MLAMIFNFLLSRLKRARENIAARILRLHIRRIAEDLKLQQEFEQLALTNIVQSLKNGISDGSHKRLTNCLTRFAKISGELGMPPPELLLVYNELAKVPPTPKPRPQTLNPKPSISEPQTLTARGETHLRAG